MRLFAQSRQALCGAKVGVPWLLGVIGLSLLGFGLAGCGGGGGGTVAVTNPKIVAPATPTLSTPVPGDAQVVLSWTISAGADGYYVYRNDGQNTQKINAGLVASFKDSNLQNGKAYTYQVSAYNQGGESAKSAAQTVTPQAPAPGIVSVGISPAGVALNSGGAQQFTATVTGSANTAVTYSVQEGAAGGTISAAGAYTAPSVTTTTAFHIVAKSQADSTKQAVATVVVIAPNTTAGSIILSPSGIVLNAGASQQFTANKAVTWAITKVTDSGGNTLAASQGGTISATGAYTAPLTATALTVFLTATSADGTQTATATVVVSAGTGTVTIGIN